jgi:hypothetical protein
MLISVIGGLIFCAVLILINTVMAVLAFPLVRIFRSVCRSHSACVGAAIGVFRRAARRRLQDSETK